jgi:hypothetical protein
MLTPESQKSPEYDGLPHQGLSEAQRGKEVFLIFSHQSAVGASFRGRGHSSYLNNKKKYHLRIMDEYYDFQQEKSALVKCFKET